MNKAELLKKLLSYGSQSAPEIIEEAAGPLAKKASAEIVEEAPQVIGKGTSKASKKAGDILDAEIVPPKGPSTLEALKDFAKKNPGKIVGGLSLAEMARQMMSGGEEPPVPPFAPKGPEQILPNNYNELGQAEADEMGAAPKPAGHPNDAMNAQVLSALDRLPKGGDLAPAQPEAPAAPQEMDFVKMMEAAQRDAASERNDAKMVRASELFGAGMARIKPEHGSSDIMRADSDKKTEDAKGKIGAAKEQQAFNKAKDELNDETKMRDPNSEVSKMVTSIAQKVGILKPGQSSSAMALKNAGVNLGTLLATIEAGNARRDAAALSRESRQDSKKTEMDFKAEQERIKREDKRKLITEEVEDRRRNIMDNINLVKGMVKEDGTFETFGAHNENLQRMIDAIAVDMAKLADPKSVARPSEVEMFKKGLFESGTGGLKLSNSSAQDIMDKFTKEVDKRAANAYKVRGISPDNVPTPAPGSGPDSVGGSGGNNNSGGMVKVLPPGATKPKLIPADKVQAALDAGGKLVE